MADLPRRLGLFSAVAVLVGSTIGSGIFRSPAGVAERIPDTRLFLAAWIAGGVCILSGALTYAELAGALPRTGGVFVYLREAFEPVPAFLFGWAELTVIRASALGATAVVFAEYFLRGGAETRKNDRQLSIRETGAIYVSSRIGDNYKSISLRWKIIGVARGKL